MYVCVYGGCLLYYHFIIHHSKHETSDSSSVLPEIFVFLPANTADISQLVYVLHVFRHNFKHPWNFHIFSH